jgi:hypothetical protein
MSPAGAGGARLPGTRQPPGDPGHLLRAGMEGEDIVHAGEGKKSHHLVLRRGERQVTRGAPGLCPYEHRGCHAAGVDELQARQIDDDRPLADCDHCRGLPP